MNVQVSPSTTTTSEPIIACGQHFSIDYGFMKGTGYSDQDEKGWTVTSIDGFRSYCLIIDRRSRYTWTFLTKTKHPPVEILCTFLKQHGNSTVSHKTIKTDEGGELWHNMAF